MLVSLSPRGWEERLCSHLSPWLSNGLFSSCPCVTSHVPRRATVTLDRSTLECPQFSWVAQFTFAPCGGTKIRTAAQEYRYGEHSSVPLGCGRCFREGARCSLSCWEERAASVTVALLVPSTYTADSTGCFQTGLSFRGLFAHLHIYSVQSYDLLLRQPPQVTNTPVCLPVCTTAFWPRQLQRHSVSSPSALPRASCIYHSQLLTTGNTLQSIVG